MQHMHDKAPDPVEPRQTAEETSSQHEPVLPEYYPTLKKEHTQGFPLDDDITLSDR
jgi:hypothetical protein